MDRALSRARRLERLEKRRRRIENNMCAICREACFHACEQCVNGHKFHIACVQRYIQEAFTNNRDLVRCPMCRGEMAGSRNLRPRQSRKKPEQMGFDSRSELSELLEGGGKVLLQPGAVATAHAIPISSLPRYQTSVAIYWLGRVQRGYLWINDGIIWYHHADQDVTNDESAINPTLAWGTPIQESLDQPVLVEARSGEPVIYLGDGREEPVENYNRGPDNKECCKTPSRKFSPSTSCPPVRRTYE
jgi:hypothetical protein